MKENILKVKSYAFAVRIIGLYKYLVKDKKEFVISKQILRSGTSVGAMIREAEHAQSKLDFIHKLSISQKEINETLYWIELLKDTEYLSPKQFDDIYPEAIELIKLLTSILKTTKKNYEAKNRGSGINN